jgi:hypothetical protein
VALLTGSVAVTHKCHHHKIPGDAFCDAPSTRVSAKPLTALAAAGRRNSSSLSNLQDPTVSTITMFGLGTGAWPCSQAVPPASSLASN